MSTVHNLFPTKVLEATMPNYDDKQKEYSTQRFMNFMETTPGWLNYPSGNLQSNEDPDAHRNELDVGSHFRKGIELWRTPSAITDYNDPAVWDWIHLKLKEFAIAEGMGSEWTKSDGSAPKDDDERLYGWADAGGPISGPDVISFWCNIQYHDSQIQSHHHCYGKVNMGAFSGVFYVDAVPEQGCIGFEHPNDPFMSARYTQGWGYVDYPGQRIEFDPAPGKLLLFPAYLKHYVKRNTTHTNRLSIAFDALFSYK